MIQIWSDCEQEKKKKDKKEKERKQLRNKGEYKRTMNGIP